MLLAHFNNPVFSSSYLAPGLDHCTFSELAELARSKDEGSVTIQQYIRAQWHAVLKW